MKSTIITLITVGSILLVLFIGLTSFYNSNQKIENLFEQKLDERKAFYQKMYVTIQQQTSIAVKNDDSFKKVVDLQMSGQKDGEGVTWKWIQQSNPTATYTEVQKMYSDLSRGIEANRSEFFEQEKQLQDIARQQKDLIKKFPNNIIAGIFNINEVKYNPIVSNMTISVFETGIESDIELDLQGEEQHKTDTIK